MLVSNDVRMQVSRKGKKANLLKKSGNFLDTLGIYFQGKSSHSRYTLIKNIQ